MAEQDAIQRMQVWWGVLDPTTKSMFEQLYERDREGVIAVISGGEVAARQGTLASFLDVDNIFDALDNIPTIEGDAPTSDPASPAAGQPFQLSWNETNSRKVDCPAYTDLIQVFNGADNVFELSIDRPALAAGETAQASAQVTGLPFGAYVVYVTLNSGGIDRGAGQPSAQGFKSYNNMQVGVGGADVAGRPDSPEQADAVNVNAAYQQLYAAYSSRGDEALRAVAQALYAFAGAVDPGGVVNDESNYRNDLMVQTVQRAQRIEGAVGYVNFDADGAESAFEEEVMAALQAIYPVTVDPSRLRDSANDIQSAIVAIGYNSLRL
ncbi:MAG: hypothetical protein ACXV5U_02975 [Ilumatobacteraceae bacterium]